MHSLPELHAVCARALAEGGSTYRPFDKVHVTEGFAVGLQGHEERFAQLTPEVLAQYLRDHEDLFAEGACLGTWWDGHEWVLDCSIVVDRMSLAVDIGLQHGQQAVYDLTLGETILIGRGLDTAVDVVTLAS
jgi:hypothetical protein